MFTTNQVLHGYSAIPIYDNHVHMVHEMSVDDTIQVFRDIISHFGYGKIQVCSLPYFNRTENYKAFYVKSCLAPSVYVSAGLEHHYDGRDTADFYLSEIKRYYAMGCDGIKMFEGKMISHRKFGKSLCDPVLDKFYAYAEEKKIPIIIHLGDPIEMWDLSKCSQYAIDKGWYCDENDPTREELRQEMVGVLTKFPKLHLVFAHFNFMSDELERAAAFMDKWENVYFDLTPGGEMYMNFAENYNDARAFFGKYQERILYGTDTYCMPPVDMPAEKRNGSRINLVRSYLEKQEKFEAPSLKMALKPFGFSGTILDKIYRENFVRLYGATPRQLDCEKILHGCQRLLSEASLDKLNADNMRKIIKHFELLK